VRGGGFGDEREKEGTELRKRRMARRGSIIENSVCIVEGQRLVVSGELKLPFMGNWTN